MTTKPTPDTTFDPTYANPDVENEHEIVFRRPSGSRIGSLVAGLFGLVVVAVCIVILREGSHFYGGKADSYAFGIGGATSFATLILLSGAGLNETVFNLDARTYRARRFRPWPWHALVAPMTGIPFWGQTLTGPLDDVQELVIYKDVQRNDCGYYLAVTWKDSRHVPTFLKSGYSQEDIEDLGRRIAAALGVEALSGIQPAIVSQSPKIRR